MKRTGLLLAVCFALAASARADGLKVGDLAPEFTAIGSDKQTVHLTGLLARAPLVLFFYPGDKSPEGAREVRKFCDDFAAFRDLKATLIGISYDSVAAHQVFIQKYHLPFLLLADLSHDIAKAYGAGGLFAPKLQTFVIDKSGHFLYINRFPDLATQNIELQNVLAQL